MTNVEVWATPKANGLWTVGLTDHEDRYVTLVRDDLDTDAATAYKNRLILFVLNHLEP